MRKMTTNFLMIFAVVLLSTSCLHAASVNKKEMNELSVALTKVSGPVHTAVRYKNPAPELHDAALLNFALQDIENGATRLDRFSGYVMKARQVGRNSSILVCEGAVALMEDTGCTGEMDRPIWQTNPGHACEYVLDLATACAAP